ncbi:hypothetical protein SAMD00019534_013210, partial [Acytostelium subglobosum LB1]|uniref:hypothetical protein n=1 Tax=Acytostelium subglobosum LB1 TaxID=1410327 RepID=UPI000644D1AD
QLHRQITIMDNLNTKMMNQLDNTSELIKKQVDQTKSVLRQSKEEIIFLLSWTWPILIANVLNNVAYLFVNMSFAGHLGTNELAAVSLGNTWQFASSALAIGSLNAMDTLISQSFGAKNYGLIGVTVQRGLIVSAGFCVLITLLWLATEPILLLLHQDPVVCRLTQTYTFGLIPGLWFGTLLTILQKYLQGQGIMKPSIIVGVILNLFNLLFNYIFVHGVGDYRGLGILGSSLATSVSKILACITIYVWIVGFKLHSSPIQTWYGFSRDTFSIRGLKEYLSLGIPAGLQMAFEGCGFEILTILAGLFTPAALGAHSIAMNFTLLTFMLPFSLSIALSVRIGQLLGARQPSMAQKSTRVCFGLAISCMVTISIIQFSTRHYIGYLYSENPDVRKTVAAILPISALFQMFDGMQTMCQGIIRGIGRNKIGAIANFCAFYVIGLPFSCLFAFVIMHKVQGLWWGLCIGLASAAVFLGMYVMRINWNEEMHKALERTSSASNLDDIEQVTPTPGDEDESDNARLFVGPSSSEEYNDVVEIPLDLIKHSAHPIASATTVKKGTTYTILHSSGDGEDVDEAMARAENNTLNDSRLEDDGAGSAPIQTSSPSSSSDDDVEEVVVSGAILNSSSTLLEY